MVIRLSLEKLGVFQESDHAALVIKVFWKSVLFRMVLLLSESDIVIQVYPSHACSPIDILARARRITWRLGLGRLPFPTFPLGCRPITRSVSLASHTDK